MGHRLQFFINSLEYNDFILPGLLRARTKIGAVSDRPFFETGGEPLSFRNSRKNSYEWTNTLELFLPERKQELVEIDFRYIKDLKAHSGHYFELMPRVTIAKFFTEEKGALVSPQAFMTLGWGDGRHHYYQYGQGTNNAGFCTLSYGFLVTSPARVDSAFPVFTFSRYQILGSDNQGGSLVRDKTSGYQLTLTLAYGLFKN